MRIERIRLGSGGEFDLIRDLLAAQGNLPDEVAVGPGDDCLVLEDGLVVSVDMTVEDVHFRRAWVSLEEAGYRAAAAALSDLAAMAAEPLGVLLSLALGPGARAEEARALQGGAEAACREEGIRILGGDLARSPGPAVLDVVALGHTRDPILRAGADPGDEIWVTGRLGGSAGAVATWEGGTRPPPDLRDAFSRPRPRLREARWLVDRSPLKALIDLSDGLGGDAGHLAAASGLSVVLREGAIPLHPGLTREEGLRDRALDLALGGGEDYELCMAAPPGALEDLVTSFEDEFGTPLTRVGAAREGEGVFLESVEGEIRPMTMEGFSHFPRREDG